jgi:hypothetical protein
MFDIASTYLSHGYRASTIVLMAHILDDGVGFVVEDNTTNHA